MTTEGDGNGLTNVNIAEMIDLIPPIAVKNLYPLSEFGKETVRRSRRELQDILTGKDKRVLSVNGPCSVHDEDAIMEYAERILPIAQRVASTTMTLLRLYFEKPRTRSRPGRDWEGYFTDPYGDGSTGRNNEGYELGRRILTKVVNMGIPVATEFLNPITPQYMDDAVTWAAIGARNVESQDHRHMASGLSIPVGFKNGTSGNWRVAIDAMVTAMYGGHSFPGISPNGVPKIFVGKGNPLTHIVLRGGERGPNYQYEEVKKVIDAIKSDPDLTERYPAIIIDTSHGNSQKDYLRQPQIFGEVSRQIFDGNQHIVGIMTEAHLKEGAFKLPGLYGFKQMGLPYGTSITDACISIDVMVNLLVADNHMRSRGFVSGYNPR